MKKTYTMIGLVTAFSKIAQTEEPVEIPKFDGKLIGKIVGVGIIALVFTQVFIRTMGRFGK